MVVDARDAEPLYDLESLVARIGVLSGDVLSAAREDRSEVDVDVEMLDTHPLEVDADPLPVVGWVDGIQQAVALTYREHRPVVLSHVAAAAADDVDPLFFADPDERLSVVGSQQDQAWLEGLGIPLPPVDAVADGPPWQVERTVTETVGELRDRAERRVADRAAEAARADGGFVAVDGTLTGVSPLTEIVAVAKTVERRYLPDERVLYGLPRGWRSPRFRIPRGDAGGVDRYSCYVRVADARGRPWRHGLVRVEAFDPEVLEPLAAKCLAHAQNEASGDARWDRHVEPVARCERLLRARRPALFDIVGGMGFGR